MENTQEQKCLGSHSRNPRKNGGQNGAGGYLVDIWKEVTGFKIYLEGGAVVIAHRLHLENEDALGVGKSG